MSKTYSYETYPCDGIEDRITKDFNFIHYGKENPTPEEIAETDERIYHTKELKRIYDILKSLIAIIENHEIESLSCDRDGEYFCDCLSNAVKQAKEVLNSSLDK